MDRSAPWSQLPRELWAMIGKKLDTPIDVYRFRSVCSSWRSSVPPVSELELRIGGSLVGQRVVYLLERPPSSPEDPWCSRSREGWLIKVAEDGVRLIKVAEKVAEDEEVADDEDWLIKVGEKVAEDEEVADDEDWLIKVAQDEDGSGRGKFQLFNLLSSRPILFEGGTFPKVLCPMDYRVTRIFVERYLMPEDGESFRRDFFFGRNESNLKAVRKVIVLPESPWAVLEETSVVGIFGEGKLKYWKHGNEDWNALDDSNCQYEDLIAYKGQFYVVDRFGIVSWIDPSFKIVQFSRPVCCDGKGGDRKHLVESGGDLYVVDRYEASRLCAGHPGVAKFTADFKVYRLNQEWGKWDEVRNLGEVALFLGDYSCFSVPVKGFDGCKGNCIYFTDGRVQVFDMEDRSIKRASRSPDHLRILWPPPAWISPNGFVLSPYS